ncbi:MAG TPA: NPCBM/NEW2 domain-containing protein [Pirellulaceae bacterium]|nr:NPCBM/NEW2 domain-containing protein [Pirellulaceae bacterium]HMO93353.1 NPCBM/NEW2 domain-containing protein [Pirellulaceae bacterium]HMP70124.1 NPCBM/NEW2 domain-containing protein [Pirellulaceae bacterium]
MILSTALLLINCSASAQDAVRVVRLDGQTIEGSLDGIDATGIISGSGLNADLRLNDIASLAKMQSAQQQNDRTAFIVRLVGGGVVRSNDVTLENDRFQVVTAAGTLVVGAESIQAIIFNKFMDNATLSQALNEPDGTQDRVIVATSSGDQVVPGLLKSFSDSKIEIEFRGRIRSITVSNNVIGLIMANLKQELPAGTRVRAVATDGSTFVGAFRGLESNKLKLDLVGSRPVELDWQKINRIYIQSDRVLYLSDLQPVAVEEQALGTTLFNWQADRNVYSQPLSLYDPEKGDFDEYDRGLGTHSFCRLEYEITGGGYTNFLASVGLDRLSRHRGDCEVAVVVDGIEVWTRRVRGNEAPHQVDIELSNARKLALVVRPGEHLDLGDHVNWVDARLLK